MHRFKFKFCIEDDYILRGLLIYRKYEAELKFWHTEIALLYILIPDLFTLSFLENFLIFCIEMNKKYSSKYEKLLGFILLSGRNITFQMPK